MSYRVLARKWRPEQFDDLIGQEHVSQTLKNSIRTNRVHHAFLFTGARGVGKTSAARIFAKALNCVEGPTTTPCGQCASCVEIRDSRGTDVIEIDGASHTGVDDIRELRENIRYLPSHSRYKIFIVDEVHMLSKNAFNALLKILEEPPEHAKFIFATTEPHKIIDTILSRCQRFDFRKIRMVQLIAHLRLIATEEKLQISDLALQLIARSGGGSMRDALSCFDQMIAFCGDSITDEAVQSLLGQVDQRMLINLLESILDADAGRCLALVNKVDERGVSYRQLCQQLLETLRSMLIIKTVSDSSGLLDLSDADLADLRTLTQRMDPQRLQWFVSLLMSAESEMAHSSYPRLTLELLLLKLIQLPEGASVTQLIGKLDYLEKRLAGKVAAQAAPSQLLRSAATASNVRPPDRPKPAPEPRTPVAAPAAASESAPLKSQEVAEPSAAGGWPEFVNFVNQRNCALGAVLAHAHPLQLPPQGFRLAFAGDSFHRGLVSEAGNRTTLEQLAGEFFGCSCTLQLGEAAAGARVPLTEAQKRLQQERSQKQELQENAVNSPIIQAATRIFDAEVEEVRPIDNEQG